MPDRSSSLALARSCMPAASLLVKDGEPGDSEKVAAWARHARPVGRGLFFFFFPSPRHMWDLSSPIQDERLPRCSGSAEPQPLDRQGMLGGDFNDLNLVREIRRQGGTRGQLCRSLSGGQGGTFEEVGLMIWR